jgi:antitoxin HicB
VLSAEDEAFNVTAPDIPVVITCVYSIEQALEYAADAIQLMLGEYIRRRLPIPVPSRPRRGMHRITLPALVQAKLSLYGALRDTGVRKGELARRLGWQRSQVERLLDLGHASRMDQLEAAFHALGKGLSLQVTDLNRAA